MTAAPARRRRLDSPWLRLGATLVAVLVGLALGARLLDASLSDEIGSDVRSSSYSRSPDGSAALAELLRRNGHPIERQRGDLAEADLDPATTLFVLEPDAPTDAEIATILELVTAGGRLVIGGPDPDTYLRRIFDRPVQWHPDGPPRWRETSLGLTEVRSAAQGSFAPDDLASPLVAADDAVLAAEARRGEGTVVMLADVTPLHNELLDEAENAALGILLAGSDGRTVVFAEGVHGFGQATGLDAIPVRWRVAGAVGLLAAVAYVVARARRLGPPVPEADALAPARREYVDSIAATLERSNDRFGVALALRERMPPAPTESGIDPELGPWTSDDDSLVRIGRAHWRATTKERQ